MRIPAPLDIDGRIQATTAVPDSLVYTVGLEFDPEGRLHVDMSSPIATYTNGLPLTLDGALVVDDAAPISYYLEGLPRTRPSGAVAVAIDDPALPNDSFHHGMRFNPAGRLHITLEP